jgi:hypothetical protein
MRSPHETRAILALIHLPIVELLQLPLDARDHQEISVLVGYFGEVYNKTDRKRGQNCVISYIRKHRKTKR